MGQLIVNHLTKQTKTMTPEKNNTLPEVTVVIPCYNHAHYLEECILSIQAQTYSKWKVLVVDDAAPDSEEMHQVVSNIGDRRVRIIKHDKNLGLAGSRNTGIRESDTPLFTCVDADDKLEPNYLERLVNVIGPNEALDCVFTDVRCFGIRYEIVTFHVPSPGEIYRFQSVPGPGPMMRKAFWQRVGGYDEAEVLRHGREDWEFWIRAFTAGCRAVHIGEPLYLYRTSVNSMNISCRLQDHKVARYIHDKHREHFEAAGASQEFLSFGYQKAAFASFENGQRSRALRLATKAWRLQRSPETMKLIGRSALPPKLLSRLPHIKLFRETRAPLGGYPVRGAEKHAPFFIIGSERSGNTLLRRILTAHSELHIPPETFVLRTVIEKFQKYKKMDWDDLVYLILSQFEFYPEFYTFDTWLGPLVKELVSAPRNKRNLAFLLDSFYRYHGAQKDHVTGKNGRPITRWGDKTPLNSWHHSTLEMFLDVFPDAQFIHIYRDGCDVVHSHLTRQFTDLSGAAKRWRWAIRQTRRFTQAHPDKTIEIRYEDLVTDPEPTVKAICAFLNINFEPEMLASEQVAQKLGDVPMLSHHQQVAKPINVNNIGKGRRKFTKEENEVLQNIIGQELEKLGYPPCTTSHEEFDLRKTNP